MDSGMSGLLPVYDVNNNRDGMNGGGSWIWIFVIFILFAFCGGGMFGNRGGVSGEANMVNNDFLYTNLKNTMDTGFTQLANQNFGLQKDMWQGFTGVDKELCCGFNTTQREILENRFASQQCCCETNRNIDSLRYEGAKNTCDIVNAIRCDGDATRALINANVMQELRDQLQAAQLTLANANQTTTIVNAVRPFPSPAYVTCSPYTSPVGFGGFNGFNGGGCCNNGCNPCCN